MSRNTSVVRALGTPSQGPEGGGRGEEGAHVGGSRVTRVDSDLPLEN